MNSHSALGETVRQSIGLVRCPGPAAGDVDTGPAGRDRSVDPEASTCELRRPPAAGDGLFPDGRPSSQAVDRHLAAAAAAMPRVGDVFVGFHLVEELGRGAFATVFLARQVDLADRPVVLKVSAAPRSESQTLAQLQHTHIVPIHSAHRRGPLQAVCMPYFGSVTLADVYRDLEGMPSLPGSGRELVSTLTARREYTLRRTLAPAADSAEAPPRPAAPAGPTATLVMLEGLSYVEAVLWLAARLADGLAYAHERGIVHRDLKPANVLLTDDGQPMLLDFNLADDPLLGGSGMGGTLPYMAPEQLESFRGRKRPVDGRSDVYSLGVILYELLTRKHPFKTQRRATPAVIDAMIQDRQGPPPRLRPHNRAVSPAAEAIVRKCLEADPARRYQSARELKEDVERHLAHQSLRHTPEPSRRERLRKWARRHPTLSSAAGVGTLAAGLVVALAAALAYRGERLARLQAEDGLRRTGEAVHAAQALLFDRNAGPERREEGLTLCRTALDRFGVLGDRAWQGSAAVRPLTAEERDRLADHVGDILFLLADATRQRAGASLGGRADDQLRQALAMNSQAVASYEGRGVPRAVWRQRAELARLLGLADEERQATRQAQEVAPRPDKDGLLTGYLDYADGKYRQALPLLRLATREVPQSFVAWFARGLCHYELLQDAEAVACFTGCVALRPDFPWGWYNRGLAHRRLRQFEPARDDFDKFVALQPDGIKGYVNRALAADGLRDFAAAERDVTRALGLAERQQAPATSLYFLRSRMRAAAGDMDGARADHAEGLRRPPADEAGFIDRGLARVAEDPPAALADFDRALELNPQSFEGLQNKAALLVDKFGRDAEALRVMDRAVKLYPDSVLARGGRGVLLARVGRRDEAVEDARAALLLDAGPPTLYQAACVYALTSRRHEADRVQAMQLLASALRQGYGLDLIDRDQDLDPLRGLSEYRRLVDAARSLRAGGAGVGTK